VKRPVTFRGKVIGAKVTPPTRRMPPTRSQCEACEWFHVQRSKCVHPKNGRPCNPARVEPWAWGMPCPAANAQPTP
jgi:hypothetical protein